MKLRTTLTMIAFAAPLGAQTVQAPKFEVDMLWPKPLPTHWLLGSATGLAVDSRDHVWVVNLPNSFTGRTETGAEATPPIGECCFPSPNVLEFEADGTLVGHWGGPGQGYTWPSSNSGLAIAPNGNIWIGGAGPRDTQILEFTRDGKFVRAIGKEAPPVAAAPTAAPDTAYAGVSRGAAGAAGGFSAPAGRGGGRGGRGGRGAVPPLPANSAAADAFGGPTRVSFDAKANEAYVADGSRNHRVAVVDMTTGVIKRFWSAYGNVPSDTNYGAYSPDSAPISQFRNPVSCAEPSNDGLVYVCDRANDRIQVFDKSGKFIKEKTIAPSTKGAGSVWDVTFSRDAQQKYLYVADGQNMKVWILDRQTLEPLSSFGDGGRQPGEFFALHSIVTDSKGNVYTVEALEGKRLQKFVFKGVSSVPKNQGVTWAKGGK
jgi:DNA-binding beta-propeller fold protein YncE